jgi:cytochrome c
MQRECLDIAYQPAQSPCLTRAKATRDDPGSRSNEDEMNKLSLMVLLGTFAMAAPALAGDPAVGEKTFAKCKACHSITAADGTSIVKGGKTGPDLFGVIGRPVASVADFKYGESIKAVGAAGAVWDEAKVAAYVVDPGAWLAANGAGEGAKSNMTFKLAKGGEDVAAYLATLK